MTSYNSGTPGTWPDPADQILADAVAASAASAAAAAAAVSAAAVPGSATLVTATGSTTARTLAARAADTVNLLDNGCACDGVADDYTPLAALVTRLGSAVKTLLVPGPCKVGTSISLPANLSIRFDNDGAFTGAGIVTSTAPQMKIGGKGVARAAWPPVPPSGLLITDDAKDAETFEGFSLEIDAMMPSNPRPIFLVKRSGTTIVWDGLAVAPYAGPGATGNFGGNRFFQGPANGAMLLLSSDLGTSGTVVSITNGSSGGSFPHDFMVINSYDPLGFEHGTANGFRRFTLTDDGLLVFGTKVAGSPALRNIGGNLLVQKGDQSGHATLEAGALYSSSGVVGGDSVALNLRGGVADGATAKAVIFGNIPGLTTAGAKIAVFTPDGTTEKACIYLDGAAKFNRTIVPISADHGDADATITVGSPEIHLWYQNLTANRTATLPSTGLVNGDHFRIVRNGLGAFTLNVGPGLKTIPNSTAAFVDCTWNGSGWILTGYGTL